MHLLSWLKVAGFSGIGDLARLCCCGALSNVENMEVFAGSEESG